MNTYNYFEMDGKNVGFAIIEPEDIDDVFNSLEMAKIYCMRNRISSPRYAIKLDDGYIPYDNVQQIEGLDDMYEWYDASGMRNIFHSNPKTKVCQIGYLVFGTGDHEFIKDYDYGIKLNNRLRKEVFKAFGGVSYTENIKVSRDAFEIIVEIPTTSCKLHITTVTDMIKRNKDRQAMGIDHNHSRVLPFEKGMDKWSTFYMFTTVDSTEPKNFGGIDQAIKVRDKLIEELKIVESDLAPSYVPVKFSGTILI